MLDLQAITVWLCVKTEATPASFCYSLRCTGPWLRILSSEKGLWSSRFKALQEISCSSVKWAQSHNMCSSVSSEFQGSHVGASDMLMQYECAFVKVFLEPLIVLRASLCKHCRYISMLCWPDPMIINSFNIVYWLHHGFYDETARMQMFVCHLICYNNFIWLLHLQSKVPKKKKEKGSWCNVPFWEKLPVQRFHLSFFFSAQHSYM